MTIARTVAAGVLVTALGISVTAAAQSSNPLLQSYYAFMANHPSAAAALQVDPSLYRNSNFMNQYPAVQSYLLQHPAQYQRLMSNAPQHPDRNTIALTNFLQGHPGVARGLKTNPAVSTDPAFLNQHPNFRRFLQSYPVEQKRLATEGLIFKRYSGSPNRVTVAGRGHGWERQHQMDEGEEEEAYHHQGYHHDRHNMEKAEEEEEEGHWHHQDHHDHGKHFGWQEHQDHHDHGKHFGWQEHQDHHDHGKHSGWQEHHGRS